MTKSENTAIISAVKEGKSFADRKNYLFRVYEDELGTYAGIDTRWNAVQYCIKNIKANPAARPKIYKFESSSGQYVLDTIGHAQLTQKLAPQVREGVNNDAIAQSFKEVAALANEVAKTLRSKDQSGVDELAKELADKYRQAMSVFAKPIATPETAKVDHAAHTEHKEVAKK